MTPEEIVRQHSVIFILHKRTIRLYDKLASASPKPPAYVLNALYAKCTALRKILWEEIETKKVKKVYYEMQNAVTITQHFQATGKLY